MNVINFLKNDFNRILAKKEVIIVALVIVPIMIGIGVLFSGKMDINSHIALVSSSAKNIPKDNRIKIDVLSKKPGISQLLLAKYDAIVEEKNNGTYVVTAIKSKEDKKIIENFFREGKIIENKNGGEEKRGTGSRVLGFIVMIILMQGVALITLFPEDRNLKTFRRVLTSPASEGQYLLSQGIFTFLCIFIPTYLAIFITKVCFGVDIGYELGMLALLIGILTALSTSLALFIASVLDREISLAASGIYVITSILGGCFYSFTGDNKILDKICSIFPQKQYMSLIQGIENGKGMIDLKGQLIYVLIWIIGLWFLGSVITKNKMKNGIY